MNLDETMLVKPFPNRRENRRSHFEDRAHLVAPDEQMPLVQEELGTVKLLRDRKLLKSRIHDSAFIHLNLSPTRCSRISLHHPSQLNTRLYANRLELLEGLLVDLPLSERTLDYP